MDLHQTSLISSSSFEQKESKDDGYFKILPGSLKLRNFQYYLDVENILNEPFDNSRACNKGGLYFCKLQDIKYWLNLHNNLEFVCRVKLLPSSQLVTMDNKCKTDRMIITDPIPIQDFLMNHNLLFDAIQHDLISLRYIKNLTPDVLNILKQIFKSRKLSMSDLFYLPVFSLEVMQWARANGCEWDKWTCAYAAKNGHLETLQWARANGCDWNWETCAYAALNGHLEVLQWARANGCEWNSWTCTYAAENGHLEVLQWARANGCEWDEDTCTYAAQNGHLEVLQWARANGCEWDEDTCTHAVFKGNLEVIQWARANGCPWNEDTCVTAVENGHLKILQWARANGCPCSNMTLQIANEKWPKEKFV